MNRPTADIVRELNAQLHASGWLRHSLNHKGCGACLRELPLEAFGPSTKNAGYRGKGRATYCRECEAARQRARRANQKSPQPH
jgi:hypothetical protein